VALLEKKRHEPRRSRRQTYKKKRRRTGLFLFVGLVVLTLLAVVFFGPDSTLESESGVVERAEDPTVAGSPEIVSEEDEVAQEEEAAEGEEEEAAPTPPDDPTMYLNVPKLGISNAVVLDGEVGLEAGVQHLEGTGYPWLPGSNTYLAGHRIGFPGTGSDRIFYNLPTMAIGDEVTLQDSLGQVYTYRVSNIFAVTPYDVWVADSTGKDMVSLQVCTETPDDWWTIGPRLMSSGPESGRLIVKAERVA
jgi:sortase A